METFGQISSRTGISRDTIRNRWKRLKDESIGTIGEDGARRFTREEAALIDGPLVEKGAKSNDSKSVIPTVEIGNSRQVIETPMEVGTLNLSKFRGHSAAIQRLSNQEALLVASEVIKNALAQAYQNDMDAQAYDISQDVTLNRKLQDNLQQIEVQAMEYRVVSRINAQHQNQVTQELLDKHQKLQALQDSTPPTTDGYQ